MAHSVSQADQDDMIAHFCSATGAEPEVASQYLHEYGWSLDSALPAYFQKDDETESAEEETEAEAYTGPRTLGGAPAPQPIPTTSSAAPPAQASGSKKKFATLGDLTKSNPGHDHDDDDDDDDDQDLFAGGEKSGLAVQNPDDLRRKLLEKARRAGPLQEQDENPTRPNAFRGAARTLGGDDQPSRIVEDPEVNTPQRLERVDRVLHFWNNGFSVDDGPLYDTSDPQNAMMLEMIRRGRAPMTLMNIQPNQEAAVRLQEHDTPYQQPKKKYKAFEGSGQRLGSPTPVAVVSRPPASASAAVPSTTGTVPAAHVVDDSQPVVTLQIRLGDGTRLVSRFNTSNTIGDIYSFVQASSTTSQTRDWVLMTSFPSKNLSDKATKLEDTPELQKGGVVIQKWT